MNGWKEKARARLENPKERKDANHRCLNAPSDDRIVHRITPDTSTGIPFDKPKCFEMDNKYYGQTDLPFSSYSVSAHACSTRRVGGVYCIVGSEYGRAYKEGENKGKFGDIGWRCSGDASL